MTRTDGLRRDRDGELVPEGFNLDTDPNRPHVCYSVTGGRGRGWLGQDAHGHPVPCPVCKPHTAARGRDLLPASAELPTVPTGAATTTPALAAPPSTGARCAEHPTFSASSCSPCWSEVRTGLRRAGDVGRQVAAGPLLTLTQPDDAEGAA